MATPRTFAALAASHLLRNSEASVWGAPSMLYAPMSAPHPFPAQLSSDVAAAHEASRLDTAGMQDMLASLRARVRKSIMRVEDILIESPYDLDGDEAGSP
jgi:hypothetical protein